MKKDILISIIFITLFIFVLPGLAKEKEQLNENMHQNFVSTFLGSDDTIVNFKNAFISTDRKGNIFVASFSSSSGFPTTLGAYDRSYNGNSDIILSKFNKDLTTLIASTYIGGSKNETCEMCTVDDEGNVYVVGTTNSPDFPTTSGAYDESYNGGENDIFVVKFNPTLTKLIASTLLGGSGSECWYFSSIILDKKGHLYVTAATTSRDFPTTSKAYDQSHNGDRDIFISKFNKDVTALLSSTFLGGKRWDVVGGLDLNKKGEVFVAGSTDSSDFPATSGAYCERYNGSRSNIIISKLSGDLGELKASTFLSGRSDRALGYCMALDEEGNVYVGGHAAPDFPTTKGAFLESFKGAPDGAQLSKIKGDLSTLLASTFIFGGGEGMSLGHSVCWDLYPYGDNIYVVGGTSQPEFPTTPGAYDETHNGEFDIFLSIIDWDLKKLRNSTFIGGKGYEQSRSTFLDKDGKVYLSGLTASPDFPTTAGAYDEGFDKKHDIFVLKMNNDLSEDKVFEAHDAAKKGELRRLQSALKKNQNLIETKDKYKRTPLHGAARFGQIKAVQFLISKGADLNSVDEIGNTPLHLAAIYNHHQVVRLLISKGSEINAKNEDGRTPLHEASSCGSKEAVGVLITQGANINAKNKYGDTPLHLGADSQFTDIVDLLVKRKAKIGIKNKNGSTPLHCAVIPPKNTHIIKLLLDNGANIDAKDKEGKTPLHKAVNSWGDGVKLLVLKGANLNAKDNIHRTPLHIASSRGRSDLVKLLIEKGADINAKDRHGKTALNQAEDNGHKKIVTLLKKHHAKK
jgi:ankyrin repeat protein